MYWLLFHPFNYCIADKGLEDTHDAVHGKAWHSTVWSANFLDDHGRFSHHHRGRSHPDGSLHRRSSLGRDSSWQGGSSHMLFWPLVMVVGTHGRSGHRGCWSRSHLLLRSWSAGGTWHWWHLDGRASRRSPELSRLSGLEADILRATWMCHLDLLAANLHIRIWGKASANRRGLRDILNGIVRRGRHAHLWCASWSNWLRSHDHCWSNWFKGACWSNWLRGDDNLFGGGNWARSGRSSRWTTGSHHLVLTEGTTWFLDHLFVLRAPDSLLNWRNLLHRSFTRAGRSWTRPVPHSKRSSQ